MQCSVGERRWVDSDGTSGAVLAVCLPKACAQVYLRSLNASQGADGDYGGCNALRLRTSSQQHPATMVNVALNLQGTGQDS